MAYKLFTFCLLASTAFAAYDDKELSYPLENLCRRWYTQSAVLGNKLYLLGGRVHLKSQIDGSERRADYGFEGLDGEPSQTPLSFFSRFWILIRRPGKEFIQLDLTKGFNLTKGEEESGSEVQWEPVKIAYKDNVEDGDLYLAGGGVFTSKDQKKLYFYDGQRTKGAIDDKATLLSYDTETQVLKKEVEWADTPTAPYRSARGTAIDVPNMETGYYMGGTRIWQNPENRSETAWYYQKELQFMEVDLKSNDYTRMNTHRLPEEKKSIGPSGVWLPNYGGEKGIIIFVAGTREDQDRGTKPQTESTAERDVFVDNSAMMTEDKVDIYDLNKGLWYSQKTTKGPAKRMGGCAVAFSAPDGKSHQIFYYAGSPQQKLFDETPYKERRADFGDFFVLNIPSFVWTTVATNSIVAPRPRSRHNCHILNNKQIVVVGGHRAAQSDEDKKKCYWDEIQIFDTERWNWVLDYKYEQNAKYSVHGEIFDDNVDPNTNEMHMWPFRSKWSPGVEDLLTGTNSLAEEKTSKTSSNGAIIGGVVGGVCAVLIAAGVGFFLWRRKRRNRAAAEQNPMVMDAGGAPPAYWDDRTKSYVSSPTGSTMQWSKSPASPPVSQYPPITEAVEADSRNVGVWHEMESQPVQNPQILPVNEIPSTELVALNPRLSLGKLLTPVPGSPTPPDDLRKRWG